MSKLKNTSVSYGVVSKALHWMMAVLVIGLLCIGLYMTGLELPQFKLKFRLYDLHKATGITVLILVFVRIIWHFYSKKPALLDSMKPIEKLAAIAGHLFLYFCMIFMPLSGWGMSSAYGRSVSFFGLFTLPDIMKEDKGMAEFLGMVHEYLAWGLVVMIILHVLAALKHHFVEKDVTLKRMLPFIKGE